VQEGDWFADQLFGRITKNAREALVDKKEIAIIRDDGQQFASYGDERSCLL